MGDQIVSPDGKSVWNGSEWVPIQNPSAGSSIHDSVIMGDVTTQIDNSVHNTYTQDNEKMVRSHLFVVAEKMRQGQFIQADEVFDKAKQIDYELAYDLYEGEFIPIFVEALWEELSGNQVLDIITIANRISRILDFDENHVPSLIMLAETSLWHGNNSATRKEKFRTAKFAYAKVLQVEPDNQVALKGMAKVKRMENTDLALKLLFVTFSIGLVVSLI